jgi:hypothetical protein
MQNAGHEDSGPLSFRIQGLPIELRLMIYGYCLKKSRVEQNFRDFLPLRTDRHLPLDTLY